MSIAQFGIGNALRGLGRNLVENYLRNPANSYANARRLFRLARSSGPMGAHARAIVRAFWDEGWEGVRAYARQLGEQSAPLLRNIEMVSMRAGNAAARVGTSTIAITEETFIGAVSATGAGVLAGIYEVGSKRKGVHGGMIAGAESAIADDFDSFLHPFKDPLHTIANMLDPLHIVHGSHHDEPDPKKPKPNPVIGYGGDFSGLVTTFYDPVTSHIIDYKGIPRKRKFSSLYRYSPFWKEQARLSQRSVLVGPSQS